MRVADLADGPSRRIVFDLNNGKPLELDLESMASELRERAILIAVELVQAIAGESNAKNLVASAARPTNRYLSDQANWAFNLHRGNVERLLRELAALVGSAEAAAAR